MKRSERITDAYKAIRYWLRGYQHAVWYRGREVLLSDEQRKAIREAEDLVIQANQKLEAVFAPAIGRAVINEVR